MRSVSSILSALVVSSLFVVGCGLDSATQGESDGIKKSHVCTTNSDCTSSQYCSVSENSCGDKGVCTAKPNFCPELVKPVCGCDGNTYNNYCFAERAGTSVASDGECVTATEPTPPPATTACEINTDCDAGQYCNSGSTCGGEGSCLAIPTFCSELAQPVCGCDGVSYSSPCFAARAGATVASLGACACAYSSANVYASTLAKQTYQSADHKFTYEFVATTSKHTTGSFTSQWDPCYAPPGALHCNIAVAPKSGTFTLSNGALTLTYADQTTAAFAVERDCAQVLRIVGKDYNQDITAPEVVPAE